MPVIHFRHCKRSAAIHGRAVPTMDRHGLRARDDEGILVISRSLSASEVTHSLAAGMQHLVQCLPWTRV